MANKKILLILTVFAAIIFLILSIPSIPKTALKTTLSPDILFLTRPVTSFTGKVEKINDNIITVTQEMVQPLPTPITKAITYKIIITKETQINRPPSMISLLFTTPPPEQPPTIGDIKTGQTISINLDVDLRTVTNNQLNALSITLSPPLNSLIGKIVKIENGTVTLKATAQSSSPLFLLNIEKSPPKEQDYTVKITNSTEISRYEQSSPSALLIKPEEIKPRTPLKLALSDLKPEMQVRVYTAEDASLTNQLTALRIEPVL